MRNSEEGDKWVLCSMGWGRWNEVKLMGWWEGEEESRGRSEAKMASCVHVKEDSRKTDKRKRNRWEIEVEMRN